MFMLYDIMYIIRGFCMNKKIKHYSLIVLFIVTIIGSLLLAYNYIFKNNNNRYNISRLSPDFVEKYFEDISEVKTDEEKENMLIVISDNKIEEDYGAIKIIEAPNNQYLLQYSSEEEKTQALEKLKGDKRIRSVEENGVYTIQSDNYNSWGIEAMALNQAINKTNINSANLEEVTVAVIDTGCDMELFNKYYNGKIVEFYDVLENSTTVMTDEYGHGTHIAGTIAEGTPDNVKIFPVKVQKVKDLGTDFPKPITIRNSDVVAAINYIVYNHKAQVINMSLSGVYSEAEEEALEAARQENIIVVAAAGNENTSTPLYPAAFDSTISVSGVDSNFQRYTNSNYGETITFTAPAVNIKSILGNNTFTVWQNTMYDNLDGDDDHETTTGTSMAAPHVASAVAILKSYNKDLTLENVIDLLKKKTIDLGDEGWDQYFGYGFISFDNVEFCDDGVDCDEFGVFKRDPNDKTVINPEIIVGNKIYDESINIPLSNISVTNLESGDYTILSATSTSANVGEQTATIRLRLSNEKYQDYVFDNGGQEKDFTVNFQIQKADIRVIDNSQNVTVKYDGNPHSITIDLDYDQNAILKYIDSNEQYTLDQLPTYVNVGTYVIKYTVYINGNYTEYYGQKTLTIEEQVSYIINNYDVDETGNYINKIMVDTDVNSFISNITLGSEYRVEVDTKTVDNKQLLYTGGKTRIMKGLNLYKEYTNIVVGDLNGDGKVNSGDLLQMRKYLLEEVNLTGAYKQAGIIESNNDIKSLDLLRLRQYLLDEYTFK